MTWTVNPGDAGSVFPTEITATGAGGETDTFDVMLVVGGTNGYGYNDCSFSPAAAFDEGFTVPSNPSGRSPTNCRMILCL